MPDPGWLRKEVFCQDAATHLIYGEAQRTDYMKCAIKTGTALLEGMRHYEIKAIDLGTGLSIRHMNDGLKQVNEDGPHFHFTILTAAFLNDWLFANLEYRQSAHATYKFEGPRLGVVRAYSGYHAASSGGDSRPIESMILRLAMCSDGLAIDISGNAGHIIASDCGSRAEQYKSKSYAVDFLIPIDDVPKVLDVRTATNIFEKRYPPSA